MQLIHTQYTPHGFCGAHEHGLGAGAGEAESGVGVGVEVEADDMPGDIHYRGSFFSSQGDQVEIWGSEGSEGSEGLEYWYEDTGTICIKKIEFSTTHQPNF